MLALWVGLVAGLLEAGVSVIGLYLPEWSTWDMRERDASLDSLWGTPLVYAAVFLMLNALLIGGAGALNRVFTSRRLAPRTVAALMSFWLGAFLVLQATDRLYGWAAALLAAGIAWRMVKWAEPATRVRAIRRSTVWLFVLVAAGAPATTGVALVSERSQIAGLPLARASAPNVLFIVLDTVRADHMSAYGYGRNTTPVFDRLAAEGVLFAQAIAPAPWTLPSHASMFTGLQPHKHGADREDSYLDHRNPTLAQAMAGQGYVTAAFSGNTSWVNRGTGLNRGFIHFGDRRDTPSGVLAQTVFGQLVVKRIIRHLGFRDEFGRRHGSEITDAFTSWLAGKDRRPFFAFLNYYDAHAPYTAPPAYRSRFMTASDRSIDEVYRLPYPPGNWDGWVAGRSYWTAAYDAGLSSLDSEIGRLLQHLATSGDLDNTLVIITSDHGEALGEHGLFQHGNSLYRHQLWVPLLVRLPGTVPAGIQVSDPVSTTDLPATVLALTQASSDSNMPGQTLSRFWSNGSGHAAPGFEPVLSHAAHNDEAGKGWPVSRGRLWSLLTDEWHFIATEGGSVELFALTGDPTESANLAQDPDVQPVLARFREALNRRLSDITGANQH